MSAAPRGVAAVIVNRTARGARGFAWEAAVLAALGVRWRVELLRPTSPDAGAAAAREMATAGAAVVVAAGGDGTVHVVANALAGGSTPLGVLPLGTANDFARAVGVPGDPADAARRIAACARPRMLDLIDAGGRAICTVGGLGVVTASALLANRMKRGESPLVRVMRLAGGGVYKLAATSTLFTSAARARDVRVEWRDAATGERRALDEPLHGVFVANQRYLGAGLRLPGVADGEDGAFELLLVRRSPRPALVAAFSRLTLGLAISPDVLRIERATEATFVCAEDDVLLGDGDAVARGRDFRLTARPGALPLLV